MLPAIRAKYGPWSKWTLMQDNASAHKAKQTILYLNSQRVQVLEWPPNSPDLNPIENAWAIIQQAVNKRKIASFEHFQEVLLKEWSNMKQDTIDNLIFKMDERL